MDRIGLSGRPGTLKEWGSGREPRKELSPFGTDYAAGLRSERMKPSKQEDPGSPNLGVKVTPRQCIFLLLNPLMI